MTLMVAPSGYGKTTLVAEWLEARPGLGVWLTLDETDDSREGMTRALVAAVQTAVPGAGRVASAMVGAGATSDAVGRAIATDLGGVDGGLTLVLDDVHTVRTAEALGVVAGVIGANVAGVHVVVSTRDEPMEGLLGAVEAARWEQVRRGDLAFRVEEIVELAAKLGHAGFTEADAARVAGLTDGWPTMVRLLLARWSGETGDGAEELGADPGVALGVRGLIEAVLGRLPAGYVETLEWLSLVEAGSDALLGAMRGEAGPGLGEIGARYEQVLVTPVEGDGGWYRVPPLVRTELEARLRERVAGEEIGAAVERGARWLQEAGQTEDAVRLAVRHGEVELAAGYVVEVGYERLKREVSGEIGGLVALLPEGVVAERADLLVLRSFDSNRIQAAAAASRDIARAQELLATAAGRARTRVPVERLAPLLEVVHLDAKPGFSDTDELVAWYQSVRTALAREDSFARGLLASTVAVRVAVARGGDAGVALAERALSQTDPADDIERTYLHAALALVHEWFSGDLARARVHMQAALELARALQIDSPRALAGMLLGWDALRRLDLAAAREYFAEVAALPDAIGVMTAREERLGTALTAELLGDEDTANRIVGETLATIERAGSLAMVDTVRSFQARLWMLQREFELVDAWLDAMEVDPTSSFSFVAETPAMTWIRAQLSRREMMVNPAAIDARIARGLVEFGELVEAYGQVAARDQLAIARALVAATAGEDGSGLLRPVLERAARQENLLIFAEHGAPMAEILGRLAPTLDEPTSAAFVERAIGACLAVAARHPHRPANRRLTRRELVILRALAKRQERREIAAALFISDGTVKRHIDTIYRKLGVNSRTAAVERAIECGWLKANDRE